MDEGEFFEAREDLASLEKDYEALEYENNSGTDDESSAEAPCWDDPTYKRASEHAHGAWASNSSDEKEKHEKDNAVPVPVEASANVSDDDYDGDDDDVFTHKRHQENCPVEMDMRYRNGDE
jgi:hypothetical protein